MADYDYNSSDYNSSDYSWDDDEVVTPPVQTVQIVALVLYSLVVLLGVPGNALVVWVSGFCMKRSVTSLWFLNLAVADLLCCLSIPLRMVPLAHDNHWHFGPVACTLVKGLFHMVMYCSIFQLVLISVDRWLMVSMPVWCQNKRRPRLAALCCVAVWLLALLGTVPEFIYTRERNAGASKVECSTQYETHLAAWLIYSYHVLVGFCFPFLVIVLCHLAVYRKAASGLSQSSSRSKRTVRVIVAVVLSFFLCWLPLHVVEFLKLNTRRKEEHNPQVLIAHVLALCLAYLNSCLNPLLYVCLGRGFKDSMSRSLRNILNFISEEPAPRVSVTHHDTKSTSNGRELTRI